MKPNLRGLLPAVFALTFPLAATAGALPYSVQKVRGVAHAGFVELVGPGKVEVRGKAEEYSETVFVNVDHIVSLSRVFGVDNACVLELAAPEIRESVSVLAQTCDRALEEIARSR